MITYFIFGISYALACVVQPGPFQAFLLSQSLSNGWRKTLPLVFAPLISDLPVIILVLLVLTNVPHFVLPLLQCFGGVFLLYLAFNTYQTWRISDNKEKNDVSGNINLFKAVTVNLLNPNPYMGWSLVMGPLLIKGWNEKPANGIVLLIGFYSSMIIYSAIMVILFAAAGNLGPRVKKILTGISVIALVLFGFYMLWSGISLGSIFI
jgi:threonine/homoserine/homoserine lactone efflux protein